MKSLPKGRTFGRFNTSARGPKSAVRSSSRRAFRSKAFEDLNGGYGQESGRATCTDTPAMLYTGFLWASVAKTSLKV
jgi:hypothetical protein